ncbi:MAG: S16 family serine protease [bacterium]
MSCTNPSIGKKLYDFISGNLAPQEIDEFEKHYLECEECFAEYVFKLETQIALEQNKEKVFYQNENLEGAYFHRINAAENETPIKNTDDFIIVAKKCIRAEEIIRNNFKRSEIKTFLRNPSLLPPILKELELNVSLIKNILNRAIEIFALFVDKDNKEIGYAHNIEINLSELQKGEKEKVNIIGDRKIKIEEKETLPDGSVRTTTLETKFKVAINKAVYAAFCYVQNLPKELKTTQCKYLNINNYSIECCIDSYSIIDETSIGLAAAIATVSKVLDLPTKKRFALTGGIGREIGNIKGVNGILPKIKAAISKGVDNIIIPEANYKILVEKHPEELQLLKKKNPDINIYHANDLSEAVNIAFDFEKIKDALKSFCSSQEASIKSRGKFARKSMPKSTSVTPAYGLKFEKIIWRHFYLKNYGFKGEIEYFVKNVSNQNLAYLPSDQASWFGWNVKLIKFKPQLYDNDKEIYKIYKRFLVKHNMTRKDIDGNEREITLYNWQLKVDPPLSLNKELHYGQIIETVNSEKEAFFEEGSWPGMLSPFHVGTLICEIYAPEGYHLIIKGHVVKDSAGIIHDNKRGSPKISKDRKKIVWEVKKPIPTLLYLIKIVNEKD